MIIRNFFISLCLFVFVFGVAAQTPKNKDNIYIVEGLFFHQMPVDFSHINGSMLIETANGTKAIGILLKDSLKEELKQKSISKDYIPEADILLEMYAEKEYQIKRACLPNLDSLKVGEKFPYFSAEDIDGKIWTNSDVEGNVMVLNCWFTGCKPCRAEMPELSEWKNEMPDVMFFSSTYERKETALPVLEKTGFNWTHLVNDRQFKDYVGTQGYPMTIVVDKNGDIIQIENGTSQEKRKKLKSTIDSLR